MKITFLIGNGFDIGVGMKSKFSHYFPLYIETADDKENTLRDFADEISKNEDKWSNFEKQLGVYTNKFTLETKNILIEQIKDFELGFIEYLKEQEKKLAIDNSEKIAQHFRENLTEFYLNGNLPVSSMNTIKSIFDEKASESHQYNFINFNYTNVLKRCLANISDGVVRKRTVANQERTDTISQIVHVHGKYGLYPIMGVNDVSQIENKELAKDEAFVSCFVKPKLNEMLRMEFHSKAQNIIATSSVICIYGMALGETDRIWWKIIVDWLARGTNRQLIIFDYDEKFNSDSQFSWIIKENFIIDKLSKFSGYKMDSIRQRIHIAVHKNIFAIDGI